MHRMQSGGWPYSKVGRDSSKAPSLHAAVLRAAAFSFDNWNGSSVRHDMLGRVKALC